MYCWPYNKLRTAAKSIFLMICYVLVSEIKESESQCMEPETNQWTGFKMSTDELTKNVTGTFWCSENGENFILHQTNNNNKDPNRNSTVLVCDMESREWIGLLPLCFPTCVPPNGNHLEIELDQLPVGKNRFLLGTQARFSCKNENVFVLSGGASVAHCNEDGKFNHNPKCVATCDGNEILAYKTSSDMLNVVFNQSESSFRGRYPAGTEATFTCTDEISYYIHGSTSAICRNDGSWFLLSESTQINLKPTCMPACEELPSITDAALNVSLELPPNLPSSYKPTGLYPLATIAHFNCFHPHHDLIGNIHLHCVIQYGKNNAEWNDDSLPHCEVTCGAISLIGNKESALVVSFDRPALTDRSKTSLNGRYSANTVATLSCNNNTKFHRISNKIKETLTMKCQNGEWTRDGDKSLPFCESPTDESEVFTGTEIVLLEEISNTQMKNDAEHSAENILFIFSCICIFIAIVAIAITMNINKNCWDRSQTKSLSIKPLLCWSSRIMMNWRDLLKKRPKIGETPYTNIIDSSTCIHIVN